ncbi:dTDP-4-dehydrorhamnose 3,5-epimerase family protein [Roseovarius sp. EL26]|uniref:dTDP-4-dehydrorhamnose 3,5-epimerase family protein n=1 Tax=Roseovarius sp. EL26 TaxID=2126672 RepID=UPI000EA16EA7|nr:dTDP-4-dehydrorhamnose 3,5-epimerase family protein [Roseovarius sp. EL26]
MQSLIDGVKITPKRQILDERGKIMHMLKTTDPEFEVFGEIYFSCVNPGAIKAWHIHKEMTLNYAVPFGNIKFVLYDDRKDSPTKGTLQEVFLGPDNYALVTVPPLVWNGFKGLGTMPAVVANCASHYHTPGEIDRCDPFDNDIPYNWDLKHG